MNHMIGCTTGNACTSAAHTIDDILIRNININCIINSISQFCKSLIQNLCLRNCTRESIKYISILAVIICYSVKKNLNSQLIRNELSLVHIFLSLHTKLCTALDIGSENVTCRDVGNRIFLRYHLGLCTLTCAGCA